MYRVFIDNEKAYNNLNEKLWHILIEKMCQHT